VRPALLTSIALIAGGCGDNLALDPPPPVDAMPRDYPPWTLVVLPDTQGYTYMYPEVWYAQTRWIAEHAAELNVRFIVHVGDITDWNTPGEWDVATRGLADLDGVAPLTLVPGNHDYDVTQPRASRLTSYWPVDAFTASPTHGGLFEPDRTDNNYQLFEVNGDPWLVLGLEWGPRDAVLTWAAGVLDGHPDHHVIVVTHAYLYLDNRRYDWATHGDSQRYNPHAYVGTAWPEVNDGEEIWQQVIAPRANVEVVVSGHVPDEGVGRQTSEAADGQLVHELLADFQSGPMGGNGYLRLMTFYATRIEVRTYSPYLDAYEDSPAHRFSLPWSP
jgi:predicted phosphodiesterase